MRNDLSDRAQIGIIGNLLLGPTAVNSKTVLLYASLATPAPSLTMVWAALSKAANPKNALAVWRTPKSPTRKLKACALSWT